MGGASLTISGMSNRVGAGSVTQNDRNGALQVDLRKCVRKIFSTKTWLELSELFGISERTAKHRLAGTRKFSAEDIADLLQTEAGLSVLTTLMGSARPRWWVGFLKQMAIADARAYDRAAKRKLREALDAVDENEAAFARAETALCIQDEDFGRAQFAGRHETTGITRRAVAQEGAGMKPADAHNQSKRNRNS